MCISTTIRWINVLLKLIPSITSFSYPSTSKLKKCISLILFLVNNESNVLQLYLVGAFCENYYLGTNRETWDVDLILRGDIQDYTELKDILNKSIEIGFKHNILIDIAWRNILPNLNLFPQEKIITYTNVEQYTLETEWKQSVEGEIKEILSGLYYVKFNPIKTYNKFIIANKCPKFFSPFRSWYYKAYIICVCSARINLFILL